jgi:hypothetical protein
MANDFVMGDPNLKLKRLEHSVVVSVRFAATSTLTSDDPIFKGREKRLAGPFILPRPCFLKGCRRS